MSIQFVMKFIRGETCLVLVRAESTHQALKILSKCAEKNRSLDARKTIFSILEIVPDCEVHLEITPIVFFVQPNDSLVFGNCCSQNFQKVTILPPGRKTDPATFG